MKMKLAVFLLSLFTTLGVLAQSDYNPNTPCNSAAAGDCNATYWATVQAAEGNYHTGLFSMADSFADCALEAYDADFINTENGTWSFWGAIEFISGLNPAGGFVNTMQAINNCLDALYEAADSLDNNFLDDVMFAEHTSDNCMNGAGCEVDPAYYTPWP